MVSKEKAEALQKVLDQFDQEMAQLPAVERGYVEVARDAQVANELYLFLVKKQEETRAAEYMQPTNVQIVDEPTLPDRPERPRKGLTLIAFALLGLLFGCGYVVLDKLLHRTIDTAVNVEDYVGLPLLGVVPGREGLLAAAAQGAAPKHAGAWSEKWEAFKEFIWKK